MILVTGATGMFGGRVLDCLLERKVPVRGLTHTPAKAALLEAKGAEAAVASMDEPETLAEPLRGVERIFLLAPMDEHVERRETNVIGAARSAGVAQVVKLYGAVRHRGDRLVSLHDASIAALKASGLAWALVSPNTVMESNLLPLAPMIREEGVLVGAAGAGKVGMVAAGDCARAAAEVLTGELASHHGHNYEITGPEALTFNQIAERFSLALGRTITYQDMPVEEFGNMLIREAGFSPETIEIDVLCHFRAFRRGDADLVTDTFHRLTGLKPTAIDGFIRQYNDHFSRGG